MKNFITDCACVGSGNHCSQLGVYDFKDGDVQVCIQEKVYKKSDKEKNKILCLVLDKKKIEKLKKFLNNY